MHCWRLLPTLYASCLLSRLFIGAVLSSLASHTSATRYCMVTPKLSCARAMVNVASSCVAAYRDLRFRHGSQDWSEPFRRYTGLALVVDGISAMSTAHDGVNVQRLRPFGAGVRGETTFSALGVYDQRDVSERNCPLIQVIHVTAVKRVWTDKRGAPCATFKSAGKWHYRRLPSYQ